MSNYVIENGSIKKELIIEKDKIKGFKLCNKITGKILTSLSGSEEFEVSLKTGLFCSHIKASSLKIEGFKETIEKTGKRYEITFKPFKIKGNIFAVALVYDAGNNDIYIRKHLEISFKQRGEKLVNLDYINFETFNFDPSLSFWSVPKQADSHIPGFALSLGQPLYVDCFFFGCEFPVALSKIKNGKTSSRYFSGKSLNQLIGSDKFISESYVIGAAEGSMLSQVQRALFSYIKDISKPIKLRRQYNSWYDHKLNITEKNISESFSEIDKGLTRSGEKPLDSFVADDGWNDYSKDFWSFNENFPQELYPFMKLSKALGSDFGLWMGPRGGYTSDCIKFAKNIEKSGNGYVNRRSLDVCVASDRYIEKTSELILDFENRFDLNYWKLDGFARMACRNSKHDHMTGGYKDMYFYTDIWEKWIEVFNKMQKNGGDNFWINLTCYAWPSPWFLRYANSLWMQISDDAGFIGNKKEVSDKDGMLSYRDERYFDFYNVRQFQFPQYGLYNHDPIYGNEANVTMTDEEFRSYLFTMATRGNTFWELYYSHNMMNENKWRINYAAMRFIENNMSILASSVVFGNRPSLSQIYGYSCFGDYEGIVSLRNPSNTKKEYTLVLDEKIGVTKRLNPVQVYTVLPYTAEPSGEAYGYGDKVQVELLPYETIIFHFGKQAKPLEIDFVKSKDERTLEITFSDTVNLNYMSCGENEIEKTELLSDYMTALVTFKKPFENINILTLNDVRDITGNKNDITAAFDYYENDIVTKGIMGNSGFTVKVTLDKNAKGVLYSQGEEINLSVYEGHILFKVGLSSVISYKKIEDIVQIAAVRERNGTIKLYINGKLDVGAKTDNAVLSGIKGEKYDEDLVVLYNRALAFDEV